MQYQVKNASGQVIAFFEDAEEAKLFAAMKSGCSVHVVGLNEDTQLTLPTLLTEG